MSSARLLPCPSSVAPRLAVGWLAVGAGLLVGLSVACWLPLPGCSGCCCFIAFWFCASSSRLPASCSFAGCSLSVVVLVVRSCCCLALLFVASAGLLVSCRCQHRSAVITACRLPLSSVACFAVVGWLVSSVGCRQVSYVRLVGRCVVICPPGSTLSLLVVSLSVVGLFVFPVTGSSSPSGVIAWLVARLFSLLARVCQFVVVIACFGWLSWSCRLSLLAGLLSLLVIAWLSSVWLVCSINSLLFAIAGYCHWLFRLLRRWLHYCCLLFVIVCLLVIGWLARLFRPVCCLSVIARWLPVGCFVALPGLLSFRLAGWLSSFASSLLVVICLLLVVVAVVVVVRHVVVCCCCCRCCLLLLPPVGCCLLLLSVVVVVVVCCCCCLLLLSVVTVGPSSSSVVIVVIGRLLLVVV
jgi:hypothetical protein